VMVTPAVNSLLLRQLTTHLMLLFSLDLMSLLAKMLKYLVSHCCLSTIDFSICLLSLSVYHPDMRRIVMGMESDF